MNKKESNNSMGTELSHIDETGKPTMVDISDKVVTKRRAIAKARVVFPQDVAEKLRSNGIRSHKGSVFDVAIVAATMAVKKTQEMIPFCHPLPIQSCDISLNMCEDTVNIACDVEVEGKTGVEMEALHGASVAALTVYDMCKALSHDIQIESIRLVHKSGGKS